MATISVEEAEGPVLDWLVARAARKGVGICLGGYLATATSIKAHKYSAKAWSPSTDPAQGWPLMEEAQINIKHGVRRVDGEFQPWVFASNGEKTHTNGATSLIAGMRCFVIYKIGAGFVINDKLLAKLTKKGTLQ